jgi:hypothetical protein
MVMEQFDTEKLYLGKLCKRGHDWNGTEKSLRNRKKSNCVSCVSLQCKEWRKKNSEKVKLYEKKRSGKKNSENRKLYQKEWREKNPKKIKEWREKNYENIKLLEKEYYDKNKKIKILQAKEWREKNPERSKLLQNKRRKERYKIDSNFRLNHNIGSQIYNCLKGNKHGKHWEQLVGYTLRDLMRHLEKQFTNKNGYTWENYGWYWHIDHIIPIAIFNFTRPENPDFKRCWALSNLQPLYGPENISKGATIKQAFQPMLQIELG